MSAFDHVSDDEFAEEMQRRLARGTMGYAGLFSPEQLHYKGMWAGIVETISELSNEDFDNHHVRRLRERMHELVDNGRPPPEMFAINTTFHGRSAFEDHAPKGNP